MAGTLVLTTINASDILGAIGIIINHVSSVIGTAAARDATALSLRGVMHQSLGEKDSSPEPDMRKLKLTSLFLPGSNGNQAMMRKIKNDRIQELSSDVALQATRIQGNEAPLDHRDLNRPENGSLAARATIRRKRHAPRHRDAFAAGMKPQSRIGCRPTQRPTVARRRGTRMLGLMQRQPLLVSAILHHAARHHGGAEVVSRGEDGVITRATYAEVERRARRLATALGTLGVGPGDRVATLAWNSQRHLELYYAVSGRGSVVHTVNPRLAPGDIVHILNDAGSIVLCADPCFAALLQQVLPHTPSIRAVVVMADADAMPAIDAHDPGALLRDPARRRH